MTKIMTIFPRYASLLVGLWELLFKIGILFSRLIRDSQVKSRQFHLIWDTWTVCKDFEGVPGDVSLKKNRNLRSSNCWKCTEMVNLTVTMLFLYHSKYFTISSGGPLWFLEGCVRTPCTPLPTGLVPFNGIIHKRLKSRTIVHFSMV